MRRFLLNKLMLLAVLVAVIIGAAWYLLQNEDFLKSQLSAYVLKKTGRELVVDGRLQLDLGRETIIEAQGIRFQNATWADSPEMLSLGRLRVALDVLSLLGDTPVIPSLLLEDCEIQLIENEVGAANWDVLPEAEAGPEPASGLPLLLLDTQIRNCRLSHDAPDRKQPLQLEVFELALRLIDGDRWQGSGAGRINDEALSFTGKLAPAGALMHGQPLKYEVELGMGRNSLRSSGSIEEPATGRGANLTFNLQGPEMAAVLDHFNAPAVSSGAFDFRLTLDTEGQMTEVGVEGDLGSLQMDASGQLDRLVRPQTGALKVALSGPDLEALGATLGVDGMVSEPFVLQAEVSIDDGVARANKLALETRQDRLEVAGVLGRAPTYADSELTVHGASDEIGRWRGLARLPTATSGAATLDGVIRSDADGLFSTQAKLGFVDSALDVDGQLGTLGGLFEPDLAFNLESPNAAALAERFGLDSFPALPLQAGGRVARSDAMIQLGSLHVMLGEHEASVDGIVNPAKPFTGSAVDVSLDSPSAAELGRMFGREDLPAAPLSLSGRFGRPGDPIVLKSVELTVAGHHARVSGQINPGKPYTGSSVDVQLISPSAADLGRLFGRENLPEAPLTAQGRISRLDQRLRFEAVSLDMAGHRVTLEGYLNPGQRLAGSDFEMQIDSPDVAMLALLFGQEGLPHEAMQLNATLKPEGKGLRFQTHQGTVGKIRLAISGRIPDLQEPLRLDADIDVQLPSLTLLKFLAPDAKWPDLPFTAAGRLQNHPDRTQLGDVRLTLGDFEAGITGDIFAGERFELNIEAGGPDASQLEPWLGRAFVPEPFSLTFRAAGASAAFDLSDIEARLGKSRMGGNLQVGLGTPKKVSGSLASPFLDLSQWNTGDAEEPPAPAKSSSAYVFDDTSMMWIKDYGVEVDVVLNVVEIDRGNTQLRDVELGVLLGSNRLEFAPFSLTGDKSGTLRGSAVLDDSGAKPVLDVELAGKGLRLGLAAAPGQDIATYPSTDLELMLHGTGFTLREMASSLDGRLRAYAGPGQVASAGVDLLFSDFLTELFEVLNPLAETNDYTRIDCGVIAANISEGKIDVRPVVFHTEGITIFSSGTVDLQTEKINLSFNTKPRKGLGITAGTVINTLIKVGGTLKKPSIELDPAGAIVGGTAAVATAGLSIVAKSFADRFLSSKDPCGDARKDLAKRDM